MGEKFKQKAGSFCGISGKCLYTIPGNTNKENFLLKFFNKKDEEEILLVTLKERKNLINCNLSTKKSTRV